MKKCVNILILIAILCSCLFPLKVYAEDEEVKALSEEAAAEVLANELREHDLMKGNCVIIYEGADKAEGEALWHFRLAENMPAHIATLGYYYVSSEGQIYTYDIANDEVSLLE